MENRGGPLGIQCFSPDAAVDNPGITGEGKGDNPLFRRERDEMKAEKRRPGREGKNQRHKKTGPNAGF